MKQQSAPQTAAPPSLRSISQQYQRPDLGRSLWQVCSSIGCYLLLWYLMFLSLSYSYWLTLGLAFIASAFLIRIFIIFHDCGHGSFFKSPRANAIVGTICGVLTFTPFYQWRHDHAMHHATSGDLDRRGYGDVATLTVAEYLAMSPWQRLQYRIFRHPLLMLLAGPVYSFIIRQRIVLPTSGPRERRSVQFTNAVLLVIIIVAAFTIGIKNYLLVQAPVVFIAGFVAVWLFYCQHQFEGTYWQHNGEWDFEAAAIRGSSYFQLPRLLQWATGNIGFHHVHHLSPRIPNYHLEQVHNSHPRFQEATMLTIQSSLSAFALLLWDEERQQLVSLQSLMNDQVTR